MPDLTDEERREVLGEVLADQLEAILEYVSIIPKALADIDELKRQQREEDRLFINHALDILTTIQAQY